MVGQYAYVAIYFGGLLVVDVSVPSSPVEVGFCTTPTFAVDVAVSGNYAYLAEVFGDIRVIDVSSPAFPTEVGSLDFASTGVAVSGGYLFAATSSGLRVIDISIPASPIEVGSCDFPSTAVDVAVSGGFAYVTEVYGGLKVIDIGTPASPTEVGFFDIPGKTWYISESAGFAYITTNIDDAGIGEQGLRVIDVSNPASPTDVGFFETSAEYVLSVFTGGGHTYLMAKENGMFVFEDCATVVFSDGFESGDTSGWSSVVGMAH